MLHITCPSCAERGKIPAGLVGARIKCKKCGTAFQVTAPGKAPAAAGAVAESASASPPASPSSAKDYEGIAVEGLDAASWSLAPDPSAHGMPAVAVHHEPAPASASAYTAEHRPDGEAPAREYKLLTSKDKVFEGKFDLARLEDALNHYARQGWVAKSMCLPHVKNFQGAMQEEVVVLLER
ncbi:DUF4177 domain-containing protein [Planctomyces sp. SH-PL62]|uniref:DUF4177 domain-containing protein n=1 Tax=Planctomyces sp. SH-PL62 TaxID=1636152 RepID=UPI00078D5612|nr:DUF4177 domain-containing protein [Planctomyces sp. SH-PL62]AMV38014.1 hypothetical protein VT85_11295 [Planctomyces sp. SH-PL62]